MLRGDIVDGGGGGSELKRSVLVPAWLSVYEGRKESVSKALVLCPVLPTPPTPPFRGAPEWAESSDEANKKVLCLNGTPEKAELRPV